MYRTIFAMCFMYTTGLGDGANATSLIHRSPSESCQANKSGTPRWGDSVSNQEQGRRYLMRDEFGAFFS